MNQNGIAGKPFNAMEMFQAKQTLLLELLLIDTLPGINMGDEIDRVKADLVSLLRSRSMGEQDASKRVDGVHLVCVNTIEAALDGPFPDLGRSDGKKFADIFKDANLIARNIDDSAIRDKLLQLGGEFGSSPSNDEVNKYSQEGYEQVLLLRKQLLRQMLLDRIPGYDPYKDGRHSVNDAKVLLTTAYDKYCFASGPRAARELVDNDALALSIQIESILGPVRGK